MEVPQAAGRRLKWLGRTGPVGAVRSGPDGAVIFSPAATTAAACGRPGDRVRRSLGPETGTAAGPGPHLAHGITEHPTGEGRLYLCAIKDVYSTRIVSYSLSARMTAQLAVSAQRNVMRCAHQQER